MSQLINDLATINVSDEVLQQLDVGGIYDSFSKNYRKLDDLKNFRSDYEKKNRLMRWWHNDKLRDAQLDSAEVQAEFSKTIGQLMMINIMQSKRLAEQQIQLNEQQAKLKTQADGIAEHAGKLQKQHQVLAEQSTKLEILVHEYFALKGLTEEGAQKLIEIAREVKATKDGMLLEFAARSKDLESLCSDVQSRMETIATQVDEQVRLCVEQAQSGIVNVQRETHEALEANEVSLRAHQEASQNVLNIEMKKLAQSQREVETSLQEKQAKLAKDLEALCANVTSRIATVSEQVDEQIRQGVEQTQAEIAGVQCEMREALEANGASLRAHQEAAQQALNQSMEKLTQSQRETEAALQSKQTALESGLSKFSEKHAQQHAAHQEKLGSIDGTIEGLATQTSELSTALTGAKVGLTTCMQQQQANQNAMTEFKQEVSGSFRCLRYFAAGLSVTVLGLLGTVAHLMKWI